MKQIVLRNSNPEWYLILSPQRCDHPLKNCPGIYLTPVKFSLKIYRRGRNIFWQMCRNCRRQRNSGTIYNWHHWPLCFRTRVQRVVGSKFRISANWTCCIHVVAQVSRPEHRTVDRFRPASGLVQDTRNAWFHLRFFRQSAGRGNESTRYRRKRP